MLRQSFSFQQLNCSDSKFQNEWFVLLITNAIAFNSTWKLKKIQSWRCWVGYKIAAYVPPWSDWNQWTIIYYLERLWSLNQWLDQMDNWIIIDQLLKIKLTSKGWPGGLDLGLESLLLSKISDSKPLKCYQFLS